MKNTQTQLRCGLLGAHLSHSFSPDIHAALGNYEYKLFEVAEDALEDFLKAKSFDALNVTIPYKTTVIPYLDALSPRAARIGAVNTILKLGDGTLLGENTDYDGLAYALSAHNIAVKGKKVLILGSGGAARTAALLVEDLDGRAIIISRHGTDNYENLSKHSDAVLIINATPVGMYPKNGESPLSLDTFPLLEGVYDLIYNPLRTRLLQAAEERGLVAENGLSMLVAQAHRAAELFLDTTLPTARIADITATLRARKESIVLIGMPGVGKTTLGKMLADDLGKPFIDLDAEIAKEAGMDIPTIFEREGEAGFRARESALLAKHTRVGGVVLATGGGVICRAENTYHLKENARVLFLDAPPQGLPTAGRPLSLSKTPEALYAERLPLYHAAADLTVPVTRDKAKNLARIKEVLL
ncbi:MAG: AAA family ATPase [Clostridia bacterium]|nr:AAA family ATPase [Clostridia bacterium]